MDIPPEKLIWHYFIAGDINAFSSIFKSYYPILHNYGVKISGQNELTEDCLQSFFVYLYENRENLKEVRHLRSYLFVSFRRSLFKYLKAQQKSVSYAGDFFTEKSFVFSPEELSIKQESSFLRSEALHKLMHSLSAREREVIYLKYYSELHIDEVSEIMEITYQSVLNVLQKAMTKLRRHSEELALSRILMD